MENTNIEILNLSLNGRSVRDAVAEYIGVLEPTSSEEEIEEEIEVGIE